MAGSVADASAAQFDVLFNEGTLGSLSDAQLLERFVSGVAGGAEFEVLMDRHGPMVLGVCRRILRDSHAADDSFQATFLLLVRRAGGIRRRESLGPWLHGVARRVALRARASDALRRQREARAAIGPAAEAIPELDGDGLLEALHAEIDRLPEKYRTPIVLCYLQGWTIDEAARVLGCPAGTVGGRLARARDRLRQRLIRRGPAAPAALARALALDPFTAGALPRSLARSTRDAATLLAAGRSATAVVPITVDELMRKMERTMTWTQWMFGSGIVGMLGALSFAAAVMGPTNRTLDDPLSPQAPATAQAIPVSERPAANPLNATLERASRAAGDLNDPQEKFDAHMAFAWAQIRSGDRTGARSNLDLAATAAARLDTERRCYALVRVASARGEAEDRQGGLSLLAKTRGEAESLGGSRPWLLKSVAVCQAELGDLDAARATIGALEHAIGVPADRQARRWSTTLSLVAEARIAAGDIEGAFRTCTPPVPREGRPRDSWRPVDQAWLLTELASAAADANHQGRSGLDPPRSMVAQERAIRLAAVRRAVSIVESLPDPNEHRPSLAASLSRLGAFDEALRLARGIDQKGFQSPGQIDAIWAMWRISLDQVKQGNRDAARATLREASRLETPAKADPKESLARIASGLVLARDFDEARKIAETLDPAGRAEILSRVARQKLRDGDAMLARFLFRRAFKEAEEYLTGPPPPPPPSDPVPVPAVGEGQDGSAHRAPADPQVLHQAQALSLIAGIHARAGDWGSAERAFSRLPPDSDLRRVTALWIAAFRSHSGDVAGALAWAMTLPSPSLRAWALRGLAAAIFDKEGVESL